MEPYVEQRSNAETLSEYAALLWHWAWLLVLCALLAGGAAYWLSSQQMPVYEATAQVLIDSAPAAQAVTYTTITTSQQLAATYAQEMTMTPILDLTAKRMNLPAFPASASVTVKPIQDTQLMTVTVQDTDRERVALLASTLVQVFSDQLQTDNEARYAGAKKGLDEQLASLDQLIQATSTELAAVVAGAGDQNKQDQLQAALTGYRQSYASVLQSYQTVKLTEAQSSSGIILRQPPVTPDAPVKPKPVTNGILAAVAGLALAVGGVFLIDFLDNTIRDPQEITRVFGIPVLGTIISFEHDKNTLITALQPRSPITEAFRSLRTNINFASFNSTAHTLLVTSPSPEDGKTTVAANLANVIAQGGRTVVAVDADMRRPRLHKVFRVTNRLGLADQFIQSKDRLSASLKPTDVAGLQILTSGNLPPNPAELLASDKLVDVLSQLSSQFETTIVDAPPLLMVTDALVLAQRVDGVILVIKPSVTRRTALKDAIDQLKHVHANILGVVLNDVKVNRSRYYQYRGYYYSRKYSKGYYHPDEQIEPPTRPVPVLTAQDLPRPVMVADPPGVPGRDPRISRLLGSDEKKE